MSTCVYIDGFNLYYGACKGTPYKWLNPRSLCQFLLPQHQILKIRYFSSEVTPRPGDPDMLNRQRTYFRALRTLPELEIELGMFLESIKSAPLANSGLPPQMVRIIKTEEKGTDVNIASRLLMDAVDNLFDCAVLITNDSDLLTPVKLVRSRFKKTVGILNPQKRPSRALLAEVDFYKTLRPGVMAASQFPPLLTDAAGSFSKPSSW